MVELFEVLTSTGDQTTCSTIVIAHVVQVANKVFGPLLALAIAARLKGLMVAGWDMAMPVGVVLGGLGMVMVEVLLVKTPRRWAPTRRWLDERAAFEGLWVQLVHRGQGADPFANRFAIYTVSYKAETDTYHVYGTAYTTEPETRAEWWDLEPVYFSKSRWKMSYFFAGRVLENKKAKRPGGDRKGLATLDLTPTPGLRLPASGRGVVDHLLEGQRLTEDQRLMEGQRLTEGPRLTFDIQRVTPSFLEDLKLSGPPADFYSSKRKLLVNALAARLRGEDAAAGLAVEMPNRQS